MNGYGSFFWILLDGGVTASPVISQDGKRVYHPAPETQAEGGQGKRTTHGAARTHTDAHGRA